MSTSYGQECPGCGHRLVRGGYCIPIANSLTEDGYTAVLCGRTSVSVGTVIDGFDGGRWKATAIAKNGMGICLSSLDAPTGSTAAPKRVINEEPAAKVCDLPLEVCDEIIRSMGRICGLLEEESGYLDAQGIHEGLRRRYGVFSIPSDWRVQRAVKNWGKSRYYMPKVLGCSPETHRLLTERVSSLPDRNTVSAALSRQLAQRHPDMVPEGSKNGFPMDRFYNFYAEGTSKRWTFGGHGGIAFPLPDLDCMPTASYEGRYGMRYAQGGDLKFSFIRTRVAEGERLILKQSEPERDDVIFMATKEEYDMLQTRLAVNNPRGVSLSIDSECGKYQNFSSKKHGADSGSARLGYFFPEGEFAVNTVFLTEGEKKAMVISDVEKTMAISVPGVRLLSLLGSDYQGRSTYERLRHLGVESLVVAYDADKATNSDVLEAEKRLIEAAKAEGFAVYSAEWDLSIAKGIDDLLLAGYKPRYRRR